MFSDKVRLMCRKMVNDKAGIQYTLFEDKTVKEMLKQNSKFKNCHKGERCFILGNGPSLKTEDLGLLHNEIVFVVNQFARNKDVARVKPNYYFIADPDFFDIDVSKDADRELLNVIKGIAKYNSDIECFFPIEQRDFVRKHKLRDSMSVNYFKSGISMHQGYTKAIDYCHLVPAFGTVVEWCITMAIYMGFSEIYLLGCDNTGLMVTFKSALNSIDYDDSYGYEVSENEKSRMRGLVQKHSLEVYVRAYLHNLQEYRYLSEYCSRLGIKFVNCSSTTVIDSIPRAKLNDVVKGQ